MGLFLHRLLSRFHRYCAPTLTDIKDTFGLKIPRIYCAQATHNSLTHCPLSTFLKHIQYIIPFRSPYAPAGYDFFASANYTRRAFINTILTHPTDPVFGMQVSLNCEFRGFPPGVRLTVKCYSPWGFYWSPAYHKPYKRAILRSHVDPT